MVVIIDYGLGNLFSVAKAFEIIGSDVLITNNLDKIKQSDRLVLPGVGAFEDGIKYLQQKGLDKQIREEVLVKKKPILGICLGLQLLADVSFEYGNHKGLGFIKGKVKKLDVNKFNLKVPHIGWNNIEIKKQTPLFKGIVSGEDFYFVHSYNLHCLDNSDLVAVSSYGEQITAAIQKDNIFATQFHPEKSQDMGLKFLENFIKWNP